ncbi:S24 family peptidase [Veronia nyctiphanis]|uniref:S24 family peptidase n=1 Tax=Veronia nyctiphanis TaxID=1278244 RepID=UPI002E260942
MLGNIEPWDSETGLDEDEVEVPLFTEVCLSAGPGAFPAPEVTGPKLRFARSTLTRKGIEPINAACAKVEGNSMEPVLPDSATIGVDTGNRTIKDGDMYAIDHDGMLRVKLIYRLPGGGLRLRSFNADEYPDEHYSKEESTAITIIGRVFWYSVLR